MTRKLARRMQGRFYSPGGSSNEGYWIDSRRGRGRALSHLLRYEGRTIGVEPLARVTGWVDVRDNMRKLIGYFNAWSRDFEIQRVGGFTGSYKIARRVA